MTWTHHASKARTPESLSCSIASLGLLALLILSSLSPTSLPLSGGSVGPPRETGAGQGAASAAQNISGVVCKAVASAQPPNSSSCGGYVPVADAAVYLSSWNAIPSGSPVVWPMNPVAIPHDNLTNTSASGLFSMDYGAERGSYVLWTPNGSTVGGGFRAVRLTGDPLFVAIIVYSYQPQGNSTLVLPDFNNLSAYSDSGNCYGCGAGHPGTNSTQVPILSWTQDGAFYVNASDRLVFYSFINQTVTDIAPWRLLYDNVMNYAGIENTEWATTDGSWVYEFGCATVCNNDSAIDFYAVNVTTGRTFSYTFSGVTRNSLYTNAQINMIGLQGNDSVAALILDSGAVVGWNLWTRASFDLGSLTYFEANNVEWVPQLDSFIDVEADGDKTDAISQWELTGQGAGASLREVANRSYWNGSTPINGENWGGYNVTSHQFAIHSARNLTVLGTFVFDTAWNPNDGIFVMSGLARSYLSLTNASTPSITIASSEHRAIVVAEGFLNGAVTTSTFWNNTVQENPFNGLYQDTNVSFSYHWWQNVSGAGGYWWGVSSSIVPEGLFYNASYSISSFSVYCRTPYGCPLNGGDGYAKGTIDWIWPVGSPKYPFPSDAALAQPTSPGQPTRVSWTSALNSLSLRWQPPNSGQNPIVNYTLEWSTSTNGTANYENLYPQNDSFTLNGLNKSERVYFLLSAWNLHGEGIPASFNATTLPVGAVYPVDFSESGLPNGTSWSVTLNGSTLSSGAPSIAFSERNATLRFSVGAVSGYSANPSSGQVTVSGQAVTQAIVFSFVPETFSVTFTESGLPTTLTWSVSLGGEIKLSTGDNVVFNETNGTYVYTIGEAPGWTTAHFTGSVDVNDSAASITISWTRVTYPITFEERGLPGGTSWSINLSGIELLSTNVTSVAFEPNGTYAFAVATVRGYASSPVRTSVTVNGTAVEVTVDFTANKEGGANTIGGIPDLDLYLLLAISVSAVGGALIWILSRGKSKPTEPARPGELKEGPKAADSGEQSADGTPGPETDVPQKT